MNTDFTWKKFEFITMVQTAIINNAINATLEDDAKRERHHFSATGTLGTMQDAFNAADQIPDEMSAAKAADQFVHYWLKHDGWSAPEWIKPTGRYDSGGKQ